MIGRVTQFRLWVDWDFDGNYTNESAYLVRASGENRLSPPADFLASGRGIVDRCSLELRNAGGRYSALNTAGALYSALQSGGAYHAPMYLEVSIDGGSTYTRIFTGVCKIPQESGATSKNNPQVTIECRSRDELLLQRRISTTLADFQSWHNAGYTEGQIIAAVLSSLSATPTSVDPGLLPIEWAWWDDESALEEIWNLAAACGGRFYADPGGTYRYENATHWLAHSTSTETITPAGEQAFQIAYTDTDLYSTVTVEAAARVLNAPDVLWEPDEPVVIPPSGSKSVTARLDAPGYQIDDVTYTAVAAGGENISGYVSVSQTKFAQRVELTFTNTNAYWAAYLRPCRITGRGLAGGPTQEETRTTALTWFNTRGPRTRSMRANAFVQSRAQAGFLASFLLTQCERPRLTYKIRGTPGNPARRCGDRVTLNDSSVMSSSRDAFLTAITWRLSSAGFQQDLEAVDASLLYPYQATGYFIVGTNTLGASTKPIFY